MPAPGTNGRSCDAGRADYNANPADGCEAVSDYQANQVLQSGQPVNANIVPEDAVDTFSAPVTESFFSLCLSKYRVTLVSPPGTTDEVQILLQGQVLASANSINGRPATASASNPSCFHSGTDTVTIQVTDQSGESAQDFTLTAKGSW